MELIMGLVASGVEPSCSGFEVYVGVLQTQADLRVVCLSSYVRTAIRKDKNISARTSWTPFVSQPLCWE
jgi:hypothetical protein